MKGRDHWAVPVSTFAKKTFNPIRNIVENLKIEPHPDKPMIALSIGDPTVFGNLSPAPEVIEAVVDSVRSGKHNGYVASTGTPAAREAIAKYMDFPGAPVDAKDVIICSGCSCSLDMCITAVCGEGTSLLVPRPGFPLYSTLAEGFGVISKFYNLLPENNWQIDLAHLESLIDDTTSAILINNPSNPCGSVFPREHLIDIAELAVRYKIPVIADEIYDHFVFEGQEYHPIASVNPELPVLACGGLTKRFLVPGWRTGWIAIHDRGGVLAEVSGGLRALSQRIIGSNTLVQGALPVILRDTPQTFFQDTIAQVQSNAKRCYDALRQIPGLKPTPPQGAMYMMVGIAMDEFPEFSTDLDFVENFVAEQSVFCLPGKCFKIANFFRVVLTVPEDKMTEACERMKQFCLDHHISTFNEAKRPKLEQTPLSEPAVVTTNGHSNENSAQKLNGKHETNGTKHATNGVNSQSYGSNHKMNGDQKKLVSEENGKSNSTKTRDEVAEVQTAMVKECSIREELVDDMEHDS